MALRQQLLSNSLPLISSHSFARPALIQSLRQIKPEVQNPDAVIDTLFGTGSVASSRALVEKWEEEGLKSMNSSKETEDDLEEVLKRRIEYSSKAGEHLVEAYANLTTPSSTPSIPLPSLPILRTLLSTIKIPPSYVPPVLQSSSSSSSNRKSNSASSILDQIVSTTNHRIPLLSINPLGPLGYAWRIADEALFLCEQKVKAKALIKKGYWNEPTGPGPEWYTKRIESNLLQPYPANSLSTTNPHLEKTLLALRTNLQRYKSTISNLERSEENMGEVAGFIDYVAKSWGGLITSRYF
uniref:Ubiquinone biosynthesis protein n=1 Tax=Kwoniella pini CBS 10737 TaxID=1296096 RepID=A0A1B9IBR8_9TREE|nr:uncharacterized protein I206_00340 [Kwoniella pini CBS 10737]OCF53039.1 hypothetical protein I206_00340 [Kwoniella pini CBS 10737]